MDSNAAERALRGPVIGRLTSFGSASEDGAEATALYDSVYAALREWGVNPNAWTRDFLEACARNGRAAPETLDPWPPWRMDPERLRALRQAPGTGATGASAENPGAASQPLARAAWRDLTGHCQRLAKPLCPRPFHGRLECLRSVFCIPGLAGWCLPDHVAGPQCRQFRPFFCRVLGNERRRDWSCLRRSLAPVENHRPP